jgi:predicted nucleotide-binding protein
MPVSQSKQYIKDLKKKREKLDQLLDDETYTNSNAYSYFFLEWYSSTEYLLRRLFGEGSPELARFENAARLPTTKATVNVLVERRRKAMLRVAAELDAILSRRDLDTTHETEPERPAKVFIAHGGKSEPLNKIKAFTSALGVTPLVVEEEPSRARSVNEHIEACLKSADCAIILGTADDKNLKDGKLYPRPNVFIEIGRVQERFPGSVIYLLEEGASFSSNISEKVYERFTRDNMEAAFLKVARELVAFGILCARPIAKASA